MAQKSRPAAKGSAKAKASPKKTPAKKPKLTAKKPAKVAAKVAAKKPAAKTEKKIATKIAAPTPPPKAPPVKAAPPAKPAAAPAQIARAKSALKRTTTSAQQATAATTKTPAGKPEKTRSRKISIEVSANEAASALVAKWNTLYKRADHIEASPYNMRGSFEERTAIVHKVLGWGYILANRNDRLEVLFKDGIKYLISNYKP